MDQIEIRFFLVLLNAIILIFIIGIILFIFQYRKRKRVHEREKRVMEEQHRVNLLHTQLEMQQETMRFIGREIHDSVAQKLTLASIYTQRLEFENQHQDISKELLSISKILNDSLLELRELSKNLTDSKLQNTGLNELLLLECERVNETGICKALFEADTTTILNPAAKSFLLRIVQEFMQNSLKHARCRNIAIKLHATDEGLELTATDDGKGFDVSAAHSQGSGLNNMRRRMQYIGGIFNLQSEAGKGTRLHLIIPKQQLNP